MANQLIPQLNELLIAEEDYNRAQKDELRGAGVNRMRDNPKMPKYENNRMTVAELTSPAMANGSTPAGVAAIAAARKQVLNLVPVPQPPPPIPKMWSSEHVAAFLRSPEFAGIVTPVASVLRDVNDPHYKKDGGIKNLFTRVPTFTAASKDGDVFSALARPAGFPEEKVALMRQALTHSNLWVLTNAPFTGLMARWRVGLLRKRPGFKEADYLADVLERMPVRRDLLPDLRGKGATDVRYVETNDRSSYGAPLFGPKVDGTANHITGLGIPLAAEILKQIQENTISTWMTDNQALCLVALCNKLDKYEVARLGEKIRPIYLFPFHFQYLFSALWQPIAKALPTFLEDPKSSSAHRFSWSQGGGHRLYQWVAQSTVPAKFAAYSDDFIFVFVTEDGNIYVWLPDIAQQDSSLSLRWGKLAKAAMQEWYGEKLDNVWKTVATLATTMAFRMLLHISHANVALVNAGLGSGVSGTPEMDQVASSAWGGRVVRKFFPTKAKDLADLKVRLEAAVREGKEYLGMEVKLENMTIHPFRPDQDYPWLKFLGHSLRRHEVLEKKNPVIVYVPVRPYDGIVLSYVTPKGVYMRDNVSRIRGMMTRLLGVTASGGWYYPELYSAAATTYNVYAKQGVRPAAENDMTMTEYLSPSEATQLPVPRWTEETFPPRSWFESLLIPPLFGSRLEAVTAAPLPAVNVGAYLTADEEEVEKHNAEHPKWSDQRVSVVEGNKRKHGDLPAPVNPTPMVEAATAANAGRVPPISEAKRKAFNKAFGAARREARKRFMSGDPRIDFGGRTKRDAPWFVEQAQADWDEAEDAGVESLAPSVESVGEQWENEDYYTRFAPMSVDERKEYDDAVDRFLGTGLAAGDWTLAKY